LTWIKPHVHLRERDCSITRSIAGSGPPIHKPLRVKRRIAGSVPPHHQPIAVEFDLVNPTIGVAVVPVLPFVEMDVR
jgi:hypothetical protein